MSTYRAEFGATVRDDFQLRRSRHQIEEKAVHLSRRALMETRALGHPDFEDLAVGDRRTEDMVVVFLDLSDFTGRTFWDDQDQTVDLAHAVLTAFIQTVCNFGGHPLGLRGDGLFAGFSPGDPAFTASMALSSCAVALDGVENEVNPWLDRLGIARVQARAGLDFGPITFVRTGTGQSSEINHLGFAANFAAKCEKQAHAWEAVVGQGLADLLPAYPHLVEHDKSPKEYQRNYESKTYKFFDYRWRNTLQHLPGVIESLRGTPTSRIHSR